MSAGVQGSMAAALLAGLAFVAFAPDALAAQSVISNGVRFEYSLESSAQIAAEHPGTHAERVMHGGERRVMQGQDATAPNAYHVGLALFEARSGARINDATVTVLVSGAGSQAGPVQLQKMTQPYETAATYGGYVTLTRPGDYRLTFKVVRPAGPAQATVVAQRPAS